MKTCTEYLLMPLLLASLGSLTTRTGKAQTLTVLHTFAAIPFGGPLTNSDGGNPKSELLLLSNSLYGTATQGGLPGNGTVYKVNTDGSGFTNLRSFPATFASSGVYTNSDGAYPAAVLISSGNTLYGTARSGGSSGYGTVFALSNDGTGFTNLHNFTGGSDGANPWAGLVLSGNILYGTAEAGGTSGNGTVFALKTDGTGFTNLHSFSALNNSTNDDGAHPYADLVLSGNALYGTASGGGNWSNGTVFALNTDGTGFTNLHSFAAGVGSFPNITNSDGAFPEAGLVLSGNILYGTAETGGTSGNGTVFALNTDGTGFTNLHIFSALNNSTNNDGVHSLARLVLSGETLYGVTTSGGVSRGGTIFALNTDGTGFTALHSLTGASEGFDAWAGLVVSGNTLYGTANFGGTGGSGTVFSLFTPPNLSLASVGTNVVLTWSTNATGFILQSTTNLGAPLWTTNSLTPVVINGQNTVTNTMSGPQQFYRLRQ